MFQKLSRMNMSLQVNVDVAGMLARAAKAQGAKNFVHVSALAADLESPSVWAKTKVMLFLLFRVVLAPAFCFSAAFILLSCHWFAMFFWRSWAGVRAAQVAMDDILIACLVRAVDFPS